MTPSLDIEIPYLYVRGHLDVKRYPEAMEDGPEPGLGAAVTPRGAQVLDGGPDPAGALRDEVDDLVAAWHAQRPDLDVEPMQVLSRVSRLARHLDLARRASFASRGLETWAFDVLSALRRQGPPYQMTPGALIRATLVTSGTMTNRIDRLAEAGLVRRKPDPRDRRGVLVTLTDQGRAKVDDALADLLRRERELLASLGSDDQRTLAGLLRTLLAPFDALPTE
jgi:DNA-binding MarR family transcriptional regulator